MIYLFLYSPCGYNSNKTKIIVLIKLNNRLVKKNHHKTTLVDLVCASQYLFMGKLSIVSGLTSILLVILVSHYCYKIVGGREKYNISRKVKIGYL